MVQDLVARTLYIHLGPAKTGITAIKDALKRSENSPVLYPRLGASEDAAHRLMGVPEQIPRISTQLKKLTRNDSRDVILISEQLTRKGIETLTASLVSLIGDERCVVRFSLSCREHYERAASVYNQRLRAGERRLPDDYLRERMRKFRYAPLLRRLRRLGHDCTVHNYHPAHSWVSRFLAWLGFQENQLPEAKTKNPSLSPKAMIAKLAANNVLETDDELRCFRDGLRKMPGYYSPSQFIFGHAAATEAKAVFEQDREFLIENYGINLPEWSGQDRENRFHLTREEIADIEKVAARLGSRGVAIVKFANLLVKD
jgi:hypothetical protein